MQCGAAPHTYYVGAKWQKSGSLDDRNLQRIHPPVQACYPSTVQCGEFALFRFRPARFPPLVSNLAGFTSANPAMLTLVLGRTRPRHTEPES